MVIKNPFLAENTSMLFMSQHDQQSFWVKGNCNGPLSQRCQIIRHKSRAQRIIEIQRCKKYPQDAGLWRFRWISQWLPWVQVEYIIRSKPRPDQIWPNTGFCWTQAGPIFHWFFEFYDSMTHKCRSQTVTSLSLGEFLPCSMERHVSAAMKCNSRALWSATWPRYLPNVGK